MKKSILLAIVAVIAVIALGSCSTVMKTTNGALSYGKIAGAEKGTFSAQGPVVYILHPSLVSLKDTNEKLDTIIKPELDKLGANAATNVEITYGFDFVGFVVRYLTGGLVGLDYVKVTGTAVKQ